MSFATGFLGDPQNVGSGESFGEGFDLSATEFEDGLKSGRFAKLDTGSIDNMDGSLTPVLAGIILRNDAGIVEDAGVIDKAIYGQINYRRRGPITVDVKAGESPTPFTQVFANNDDAVDGGLAMAAAGGNNVATSAEYIEEVKENVWLVYLGRYEL